MDIDLIFKIAAIGIIVAVLNQLLIRSGREEQAMMTTLAGLIVVLMMVIPANRCTFSIHQVHFWVIAYEYFGHCRSCDFNCRFSHFNA